MNHNFIRILSTFTKKEAQNFKLYLQSPLFNVRSKQKCIEVLETLLADAIVKGTYYDFSKIDKKAFFQKVFGQKKGGAYLTHLYNALENYIKETSRHEVNNEWLEEKLWANFRYIEYLRKKKLDDLFHKKIDNIQKEIQTTKLSEKRYYIEWKVSQLVEAYLDQNQHTESVSNLMELLKLHKRYQLLTSLKMTCEYYNSQIKQQKKELYIPLIALENLEEELLQDPLIALYHQAYFF